MSEISLLKRSWGNELAVCQYWNGCSTRPTGQSGSPPEVVPNIPVGPNRNEPFYLTCDRNFQNFWHNESTPGVIDSILVPRASISFDHVILKQAALGTRMFNLVPRVLSLL